MLLRNQNVRSKGGGEGGGEGGGDPIFTTTEIFFSPCKLWTRVFFLQKSAHTHECADDDASGCMSREELRDAVRKIASGADDMEGPYP